MGELPLCGYNLPQQAHHALVHFEAPKGTVVSLLNEACFKCSYWDTCIINGSQNEVSVLTEGVNHYILKNGNETIAQGNYSFGPLGTYKVTSANDTTDFVVSVLADATPTWLIYLLEAVVILVLVFGDRFIEFVKTWASKSPEGEGGSVSATSESTSLIESEPVSLLRNGWLDSIRGLSILMMIFTNYGGGGLPLFRHSTWNGLTIADTVFPMFLYCVGCSIQLSYGMIRYPGGIWTKVLFRSFRLMLIGWVISNSPGEFRLAGVLQRIGFIYFAYIAVHFFLLHFIGGVFNLHQTYQTVNCFLNTWQMKFLDLGIAILLAGIYLGIFAFRVTGCPLFYFGPGGISEMGIYFNCTGGQAGRWDSIIFGTAVFKSPTYKEMYHTVVTVDPEGCLSTLTSMITVAAGYSATNVLFKNGLNNVRILLTSALIAIGLSIALHFTYIPYNKNLWSISFALVNAGIGNFLMLFFIFVEERVTWKFSTLQMMEELFLGRYSLVVYIIHEVCIGRFPVSFEALGVGASGGTLGLMFAAVWAVFFHLILVVILEAGKFQIKFNYSLGY